MSVMTVILEPDSDGTLHLPIPKGLPPGKFKVVAEIEPLARQGGLRKAGCLKGFWMAPDFDAPLEEFKEYSE
jgi:hypothetical protein